MTTEAQVLHDKQTNYLWYGILLIIISTLIALMISAYIRKKVLVPIFSMKSDAQAIAGGNYKTRCNVSVENEVGALGESLNSMADSIEIQIEELQKLASVDELVGISNRRSFMNSLELEIERSHRYGRPLSALMMDIDNFKSFNDSYGHHIGDEILKLICHVSQKALRDNDLMGRFGGEEFTVMFPETNIDSAIIVAERIRSAVEDSALTYNSEKLHVTVSIGATQLVKDEDSNAFLKRADKAMYLSKENGRNQTSWL